MNVDRVGKIFTYGHRGYKMTSGHNYLSFFAISTGVF